VSLVLIVIEPANQFEHGRARPGQQRFEQFNHREKVDLLPMHGSHTGHEAYGFKSPTIQNVQGIFSLSNRRYACGIDRKILIAIKPSHFLGWDS
jgi:hypothetical protein